jgi:chromosome partitioning protein
MLALWLRRRRGYLVTTSDFTEPAYRAIRNSRRLTLVNGDRLTRYISYVLRSRFYPGGSGVIPLDVIQRGDALQLQPVSRTKVLVIANNKGGVGKTTTALYMAHHLGLSGKRVLIVDLDAQINLTTSVLGLKNPRHARHVHLGSYFAGQSDLHSLIQNTGTPHVDIIAAHPDLRLTDLGGSAHPELELAFARDVHSNAVVQPAGAFLPYDWIIIDTPPALTLHTRAALAAAHYVLAPTSADRFGLLGIQNMLDTLEAMQGMRNNDIKLLGCVITRWDKHSPHQNEYRALIQNLFAGYHSQVLPTDIPEDGSLIRRADDDGYWRGPIHGSNGAEAYHQLVQEVLRRVDDH